MLRKIKVAFAVMAFCTVTSTRAVAEKAEMPAQNQKDKVEEFQGGCGSPLLISGCNGVQFETVVACDWYGTLYNLGLLLLAQESCEE